MRYHFTFNLDVVSIDVPLTVDVVEKLGKLLADSGMEIKIAESHSPDATLFDNLTQDKTQKEVKQ